MGTKKDFGWGDIKENNAGPSGSAKSQDLYFKIEAGQTYRVRIYGTPKPRYFAWVNKKVKYCVPDHLLEEFERHTGEKPRLTYICNVIDRADTKNGKTRFKLLEKGPQIFSNIKVFYETTGVEPGGENAPDFIIKATAGKEKRNTTYNVMTLPGMSPFSEKEKELIDRQKRLSQDELKKLPLGERGPIDIESFYDLDKAEKKVQDLLDGKVEQVDDVSGLSGTVDSKDAVESPSSKEPEISAPAASADQEESLDSLLNKF